MQVKNTLLILPLLILVLIYMYYYEIQRFFFNIYYYSVVSIGKININTSGFFRRFNMSPYSRD
jgi:hypothetical protein